MKKELTQAILHKLVLYHPTTGIFTKPDGSYLYYDVNKGYVRVRVPNYGLFSAHRLAFLFMEGKWPEKGVDHIDGNKANNVWANLRHATQAQNAQNIRGAYKTNKNTGLLGARKSGKKFYATITFERTKIYLGTFNTAEEANEAYLKVKRELHPFGEL